jgi:acyl-CoA thioester hydrolase
MIKRITQVRVRYSETDQMGYVYYGNYPAFFEVGRAELVRDLGVPYADLERVHDVMMPVIEMHIEYNTPARYDDVLTIHTTMLEKPGVKLKFEHEIFGPDGKLIVKGNVTLALVRRSNMKPTRPPQYFTDAIEQHWSK